MTGWEANQSRAGSTDLQKTTHQSTNTSGQSRSERRSNSRTFCRANKRRLANSCTSVSNLAHVMTCLCESTHPPITLYAGLHYNCPPPLTSQPCWRSSSQFFFIRINSWSDQRAHGLFTVSRGPSDSPDIYRGQTQIQKWKHTLDHNRLIVT